MDLLQALERIRFLEGALKDLRDYFNYGQREHTGMSAGATPRCSPSVWKEIKRRVDAALAAAPAPAAAGPAETPHLADAIRYGLRIGQAHAQAALQEPWDLDAMTQSALAAKGWMDAHPWPLRSAADTPYQLYLDTQAQLEAVREELALVRALYEPK